jgi:long-chain fatty acid transport protein
MNGDVIMHPSQAASTFRVSLIATALIAANTALAGGFSLSEMSAGSVGNSHAGSASAEDASTVYYNPAGLTRLGGSRVSATLSGIRPSAKFRNTGSLSALGTPMAGGNGGDAGDWAAVPAVYYSTSLSSRWSVGVGMHAPFGLKTEYDDGWVGRYQALKSDLKTVGINPVLAYRMNDAVSIGAGVSAQYADVELSRAIDFGTICVGSLGAASCVPSGFLPQTQDGVATVQGNDWGYGYNLGVLIAPTSNLRYGLTYRSKIRHNVSGEATFERPAGLPAPLAASPTFTNTDANASLDLPDSLSASVYSDISQRWSAMADVTWMRWSRFEELRINFANGAPASVTPENWRDTTRVSAALNYRVSDMLKLRGGVAFDESPVRDEFRTPRIPDANRRWLSLGAQFKPSRHAAVDVGYAHLFVRDSSINKAEPPVGGTLIGDYDNDVNILSVQYSHAF